MSKIEYPVPKIAREIEARWANLLASHFHVSVEDVLSKVRPWYQFPHATISIELMDGSRAEFQHAFHLLDESMRAVAVFTEHCGNYVFPSHECRVFRDGELIYHQLQQA